MRALLGRSRSWPHQVAMIAALAGCGRIGFDDLLPDDNGFNPPDGPPFVPVDGPPGAVRSFPDPTLCNTSEWTLSVRYPDSRNSGTFGATEGCYAEMGANQFGWSILDVNVPGLPWELMPEDRICIDYEVLNDGTNTGACDACDGAGGFERCVLTSAAYIRFFDASGNGAAITAVGARLYGVGDGAEFDATADGTLTSDGVAYSRWACPYLGLPRLYVDFDPPALPSRHRFRARLSDLLPPGVTASRFSSLSEAYYGATPSASLRVYDFYVGDVSNEGFCSCLGGTWDGTACAAIP
ncbi:MAG: hypothetical protein AB7O24_32435 [Kofleriaceae bacterium]